MKESIYEVILTILVIMILTVGIGFYRNSMSMVGNIATVASETDKAKSSALIKDSMQKSTVHGSDIVAVTRYYQSSGFTIRVEAGGVSKTYSGGSYQSGDFAPLSDLDFYKKSFQVRQNADGSIDYSEII